MPSLNGQLPRASFSEIEQRFQGKSLNLLALGTALWVPTPIVWAAFALMAIGSDLPARAEETILTQAFGSSYREYCGSTRRFVPGIY